MEALCPVGRVSITLKTERLSEHLYTDYWDQRILAASSLLSRQEKESLRNHLNNKRQDLKILISGVPQAHQDHPKTKIIANKPLPCNRASSYLFNPLHTLKYEQITAYKNIYRKSLTWKVKIKIIKKLIKGKESFKKYIINILSKVLENIASVKQDSII